jgi:hypothetical protein
VVGRHHAGKVRARALARLGYEPKLLRDSRVRPAHNGGSPRVYECPHMTPH